jgi:hypothetical protein
VAGPGNTILATDTATNSTFYPVFVAAVNSSQTAFADDPGLRYNPGTTTLFTGALSLSGNITAANVTVSSGSITGATLISSANISASGNITGGTLISNGAITGTNLSVGTGSITVGSIVNANANGVGNIGSNSTRFNTIFATAINALYADLAEHYVADDKYVAGTVVIFGGLQEITVTQQRADARVAGAISTEPAYLMNANSTGLPVALRGRVPVQVVGAVTKGDSLITSSESGYAESVGQDTSYGQAVFAKSLETDLAPGKKTILAVIL